MEHKQILEYLKKLDIHKSMGPEGTDSQMLRELANLTARPLTVIFEGACRLRQDPRDLNKPNATPLLKESKEEGRWNYRLLSLTSVTKRNYAVCHTTGWGSSF